LPKREIKNLGFEKSHFEGFQSLEAREKKVEVTRFFIFGFHCVAQKNTEGRLKSFILFLIFSQFWLILPRDDCHFFYIFLCMIAILATEKKS